MLTEALGAAATFLLYGYFQWLNNSGMIVGIVLSLYVARGSRWFGKVVAIAYLASLWHQNDLLQFALFVALDALLLVLPASQSEDDTLVQFRPYEEEIRQYLFKADPSVLHKVDTWLDKYRGRETELLRKVKEKYPGAKKQDTSTPSRPTSMPPPSTTKTGGRQGGMFSLKEELDDYPMRGGYSGTSAARPFPEPRPLSMSDASPSRTPLYPTSYVPSPRPTPPSLSQPYSSSGPVGGYYGGYASYGQQLDPAYTALQTGGLTNRFGGPSPSDPGKQQPPPQQQYPLWAQR